MLLLAFTGYATPALTEQEFNPANSPGMKFQNASPAILLNDYAEKMGKRIEVVKDLDIHTARISLTSKGALTMQQYLDAIEDKLKEHNIGIYPLGSNRIVAAWVDPSKAPKRATQADMRSKGVTSYLERMRARRAGLRRQDRIESDKIGNELHDHLEKYKEEIIRASESGDTNAAAPLTPQQEEGLEVVEMPLPCNRHLVGAATNVIVEARPGDQRGRYR